MHSAFRSAQGDQTAAQCAVASSMMTRDFRFPACLARSEDTGARPRRRRIRTDGSEFLRVKPGVRAGSFHWFPFIPDRSPSSLFHVHSDPRPSEDRTHVCRDSRSTSDRAQRRSFSVTAEGTTAGREMTSGPCGSSFTSRLRGARSSSRMPTHLNTPRGRSSTPHGSCTLLRNRCAAARRHRIDIGCASLRQVPRTRSSVYPAPARGVTIDARRLDGRRVC